MARPMLTTLSAMTAEADPAVHSEVAFVAAAVEAMSPFDDLMRPSLPVRHLRPLRNQRFLCSRLRSRLAPFEKFFTCGEVGNRPKARLVRRTPLPGLRHRIVT